MSRVFALCKMPIGWIERGILKIDNDFAIGRRGIGDIGQMQLVESAKIIKKPGFHEIFVALASRPMPSILDLS
jgi:hypothetical protein